MIRYILYIPQALIAEEVRKREGAKLLAMDERKRPYNSLRRDSDNKAPTEEEMEALDSRGRDRRTPWQLSYSHNNLHYTYSSFL